VTFLNRAIREPIFHFLVIGALLFGVFAFLSEGEVEPTGTEVVSVSPEEAAQLVSQFRQTWRRAPNEDELESLIQAYVREEVLVREALSLSMDVDDPVIRRRLAQKMEFLVTSSAAALVPSDEELQAQYDANRDAYSTGMQMAFEQVYLGASPTPGEVADTIAALTGGNVPETLGQRTLLPAKMDVTGRQAIENTFGAGFFEGLRDIALGEWGGPVQSGFGVHVVRITDRIAATQRPLDAVRGQVEADWRAAATEELTAAVFEELEARYQITTPSPEELDSVLQ
jgi:hypothetical protein